MAIATGKITLTGSQQKISVFSTGNLKDLIARTPTSNSENVWIGGKSETEATGNGFPIEPGDRLELEEENPGTLYVIGKNGDIVYFIAGGDQAYR